MCRKIEGQLNGIAFKQLKQGVDRQAVFAWIILNTPALIAYWDGNIDTADLIQALKSLPAHP